MMPKLREKVRSTYIQAEKLRRYGVITTRKFLKSCCAMISFDYFLFLVPGSVDNDDLRVQNPLYSLL